MTFYRYLFANVLSGQIQAELPLTGVNFTTLLNAAGTLSGQILLTGLSPASNAAASTVPGQTAVYAERDGVIVWGGIIWNRTYTSQSQTLTIQAREFESYLERRRIASSLSYYNKDQLYVAADLVAQAMAQPYGNIGVQVPSQTSGIQISRTFYGYEQKTFLSALQDLSKSGSGVGGGAGFDFLISCDYDGGGNIVKSLRLGYPMLGTRYTAGSATVPVFELPAGNIAEYEVSLDGSKVANKIYVTGAGSNEGKLVYSATQSSQLLQGWPILEDSVSFNDIYFADLLQNLANGRVAAVATPPVQLKIVAKPAIDPVFGSYEVGDDVRIRIKDAYFPDGFDDIYRLVGVTVTPGESGPERVTLSLTLPTND
jgi:hypothetical protein